MRPERVLRPLLSLLAVAAVLPIIGLAQEPGPGRPLRWAPEGHGPVAIAPSAVGDLREWDARVQRMERDGSLRLRRSEDDVARPGRSFERFDQYVNDVRVFGGDLTRQTDHGQTVSVFGVLYDGIDIDTVPTLGAEDARAVVGRIGGATPGREPELVVLPRDEGGYALAWRVRALTRHDLRVYFVDARSGAVDLEYSDLQTDVGTGLGVLGDTKKISTTARNGVYLAWDQLRPARILTFDMKGNLQRVENFLDGRVTLGESDISADTDDDWTDQASVDAHVYAGWTYDYYFKRFARHGLDNRDLTMVSLVHPVRREDAVTASPDVLDLYYLNAFYAGFGTMVYGEGLPPNLTVGGLHWNYFAGAIDVVAHELTHGVTDYSSGLIYRKEPGALNEAFSDIMGTSVEFFYQPVGVGYMKADYLLGEDLTTPMSAFRSMANPQAYGDPDHYSRRYLGTADNGGVHINSGIANNAFYLAIEGGTNRTSGLGVQGVGSANRDQIEKVFYRAFTQLLPANASFSIARAACLQAARDLYGAGSAPERAITQAWSAVGVF